MLSVTGRIQRIVLGSSFAIAIGITSNANAEQADATLNVTAGLKEALSLTCDQALNFGVVGVDDVTGYSGGSVEVNPDGTLGTVSSGLSANENDANNGVCTMSGSAASDNTAITVTYATGTLSGSSFGALSAPTNAGSLSLNSFEESGNTVQSGGATINIGASLAIPGSIDADAFGGYSGTVTVTVDDGI